MTVIRGRLGYVSAIDPMPQDFAVIISSSLFWFAMPISEYDRAVREASAFVNIQNVGIDIVPIDFSDLKNISKVNFDLCAISDAEKETIRKCIVESCSEIISLCDDPVISREASLILSEVMRSGEDAEALS